MPRIIVFDVNETLLDLSALNAPFQKYFGDAAIKSLWFSQLLQTAMATTLSERYHDFGTIARAALQMTADKLGKSLPSGATEAIVGQMRALPPHPEVPGALTMLKEQGLRLAALTNSPTAVMEEQLDNAGLSSLFEQRLSVDKVGKFKPAPQVYQMAATALLVSMADLRMVAAHDWDTDGAIRAGCAGAFVARPGKVLGPLSETPDIIGKDMQEVARKIIATELQDNGR